MAVQRALVHAMSAALANTDDLPDPAPATRRNGTSEPRDPQMYLSICQKQHSLKDNVNYQSINESIN